MRWIAPALFVLLLSPAPASAQSGSRYPWCSGTQGYETQSFNCSHPDFESCRQEITGGLRGWCFPNPRYVGPAVVEEPAPRRRAR